VRDTGLVGVLGGLGGRVGLALGDDLAHGVQDTPVAGAAAQVSAQGLAGLQLGRRRIALEEVVHGHRHARDAETALHGAALGERPLDVRGLPVGGEALDGAHLAPGGGHAGHEAGRHEPSVHLHVAGPALALRAAVLGARETEPFAQYVEQRFADPGVGHGPFHAVHPQDVRGEGVVDVRGRALGVVGRGLLGGVVGRLGGLLRRDRFGLGGRFVGGLRGAVSRRCLRGFLVHRFFALHGDGDFVGVLSGDGDDLGGVVLGAGRRDVVVGVRRDGVLGAGRRLVGGQRLVRGGLLGPGLVGPGRGRSARQGGRRGAAPLLDQRRRGELAGLVGQLTVGDGDGPLSGHVVSGRALAALASLAAV
jgi:hypothetical protein